MIETIPYRRPAERTAAASRLARHLRGDGLVAYPTETVYGFGCALGPAALERLAALKGDRPFLLLVRGTQDVPGLRWTDDALRLAQRFWPGALTLALDAPADLYPRQVRGDDGAVAVRVSPHPAVRAILDAADGPITSTSANRPGEPPTMDAATAAAALADGLEGAAERAPEASGRDAPGRPRALVLDGGALPAGRPSTILRCGDRVRLLREGALTRTEIEAVVELQ